MLNARRHWIGADPINLFFKRGIFIWPLLAEPENGSTRHFAPILLSDPSSSDHRRSVTPAAIAGGTRKILCSLTGRSMGSASKNLTTCPVVQLRRMPAQPCPPVGVVQRLPAATKLGHYRIVPLLGSSALAYFSMPRR
jgi:hypothetical protein